MPTALRIPDEDLPGIRLIRDVPPAVFANLLLGVERSVQYPSVQGLADGDVEAIVDALMSMHRFRMYAEVDADELIEDMFAGMREQNEQIQNEAEFRDRLKKLLELESLKTEAKALSLSFAHERWFCTARIFTDVRPVYGTDVKAGPKLMVIGHKLKLSYHEGNELRDFYVMLQPDDLNDLKELIQRAEDKESTLRAALEPTKIRVI